MDDRQGRRDPVATPVSRSDLLVVEDSPTDALLVAAYLDEAAPEAFAVTTVSTVAAALATVCVFEPVCALVDLGLPDADGLDAIRALHKVAPSMPLVVLSGREDEELAVQAIAEGAQDYVLKNGLSSSLLLRVVRHAIERQRLANAASALAAVVASSEDAILSVGIDRRIASWNEGAERLYGYSPEEAIGEDFVLIVPAERRGEVQTIIEQVVGGSSVRHFETQRRRKDGSLVDVSKTVSPIRSASGDIVGLSMIARDMTTRLEAERAVARAEEQYRVLFARMPHPVWVYDTETLRFLAVNDAAVEHYGYSRDEFLAMTICDIRPAEDVAALLEALEGFERYAHPVQQSWRHRKKDGTVIDVEVTSSDHEFEGRRSRLAVVTDVTERRRAERALADSERRYRTLVETASEGIWVIDTDGVTTFANRAAADMLGYGVAEMIGVPVTAIVPPERREFVEARLAARRDGASEHYQNELMRKDGSRIWVSSSASPLHDEDGQYIGSVGMMTDITEQRRAGLALAESEAQLRATIETANDAFVAMDLGGIIRDWNAKAETLFGYTRDDAVGQSIIDLIIPQGERARWSAELAGAVDGGAYDIRFDALKFEHVDRAGERFPVEVTGWSVVVEGETWLCTFIRDIRERNALEEQLRRQALEDPLTRLPNRSLLMDRLEQAVTRSRREGTGLAVLFLDLDRFKFVNDGLGHSAGDALLQAVADRLRGRCRDSDTVARYGGDEFVVVAEAVASEYDAILLGEQVARALDAPFTVNGLEVYATASVGVSFADPGATAETLLRDADAAMYLAKDRGRGRAEVSDQNSRYRAEARLLAEAALRRAVERDEFRVLYQPVVSLRDRSIVGAEALVRWEQDGQLVSPAEFIPLAEDTGLIVPIGERVLEEACAELKRICARNPGGQFSMAVNLSARQVMAPGLVDHLAEVLVRTGVHPGRLTLEITESTLMADVEYFVEQLTSLKRLGVRLAVDDFGTGYSSLAYLKRFPMDIIKIDRTFVRGMIEQPADAAIVSAMIVMARALKLDVVGEGVETEAEADGLRILGCDNGQGFLWSRPVPIDDLVALLPGGQPPERTAFRTVVADDLAEHRIMLRLELEHTGLFEVVGDANDAGSALDAVTRLRPDLLVLDMTMPGESGLDVLPKIVAASPETRVVLVSSHVRPGLSDEAMASGASTVLDKSVHGPEFGVRLAEVMRSR